MHKRLVVVMLSLTIGTAGLAVASPAAPVVKALSRWFVKEFGQEGTEKLGKEVSEVVVERVTAKVIKEGGEESLEQVSVMVAKHGSDVLRAIDNAPSTKSILRALDDLPADEAAKAVTRLAAKETGSELAEATARYGAGALRAELRHPGLGGRMVSMFGDDGASLCGKLSKDQAVNFGRHMDDIAKLPPGQRNAILGMISTQSDRMCRFMGNFISKNPGKILFTASGTTIVLANSERIFGDAEIVYDPEGNPMLVQKRGLLAPLFNVVGDGFGFVITGLGVVVILAVAAYATIKLWKIWKGQKIEMLAAEKPL